MCRSTQNVSLYFGGHLRCGTHTHTHLPELLGSGPEEALHVGQGLHGGPLHYVDHNQA